MAPTADRDLTVAAFSPYYLAKPIDIAISYLVFIRHEASATEPTIPSAVSAENALNTSEI